MNVPVLQRIFSKRRLNGKTKSTWRKWKCLGCRQWKKPDEFDHPEVKKRSIRRKCTECKGRQ